MEIAGVNEIDPFHYRQWDLPIFDNMLAWDQQWANTIRMSRTIDEVYNVEGLSKEECGLEKSIKALLYWKERNDAETTRAWANLDMIERLWFMLREERNEVRGCLLVVNFVVQL